MLPLERRQEIVKLINKNKAIKVNNLSKLFGVTEETIRRDLEKLENQKILKRTYGGAVFIENPGEDLSFIERSKENINEKKIMAKCALEFIKDGDTIMIDSSTTALEVAKGLNDERNVTIITNSLTAADELALYNNCKIVSTGGILNSKTMSFEGPLAVKTLKNYYADKAIFSCKGIDLEQGIMESQELASEIKVAMIHSAKQVILIVDKSKFEKTSLVKIDDFSNVDILITNNNINERWMHKLEQFDIEVIIAEE